MNFLDKLKEEWTVLNESITTFNTPEHQEIIRKMDKNTDEQERMNTNKTTIFTMYDCKNRTWNVMTADNQCLFYGTIDELENWLVKNEGTYIEELC